MHPDAWRPWSATGAARSASTGPSSRWRSGAGLKSVFRAARRQLSLKTRAGIGFVPTILFFARGTGRRSQPRWERHLSFRLDSSTGFFGAEGRGLITKQIKCNSHVNRKRLARIRGAGGGKWGGGSGGSRCVVGVISPNAPRVNFRLGQRSNQNRDGGTCPGVLRPCGWSTIGDSRLVAPTTFSCQLM
jgi:hypothetical protein